MGKRPYPAQAGGTTPFKHPPRRKLTKRDYAKFFESRQRTCEGCGRPIRPGERWTRDHIIALTNGGPDVDENCQLLCKFCDSAKTPSDLSQSGKGKRQATNFVVPKEYRGSSGFYKPPGAQFNWRTGRYEIAP